MVPVELSVIPGSVPPPRSGNVAYLANLSRLFFENEELTARLRETVQTLESYGGRLLPILCLLWDGERSILAIERRPWPDLETYFRHDLRLRLPRLFTYDPNHPWSGDLPAEIRKTPHCHLDGFVTDHHLAELAARTGARLAGSVSGSRQGNNKVLLRRFLEQHGELVFDGFEAASPRDVRRAARSLSQLGYRTAVAKAAVGASGIGLARFETSRPPEIPESYFLEGPCLVEGWLDRSFPGIKSVASPSVQMVITESRIFLYDITDQILSPDSIHEGNTAPPESFSDPAVTEELLRLAGVAARWLHTREYRGTASADFHLARRDSDPPEIRICELNARVTGATYPSLMARHFLPKGAWLMRNLHFPDPDKGPKILHDLLQSNLLFRPGASSGVLPFNLNTDDRGRIHKGQFLFLASGPQRVRSLLDRTVAKEHLSFTRD